MISFDYWHWFVLSVLLLILEVLTPTSFFVWIAVSAFITGILSWVFPFISLELLGVIFAVMSVACAYYGRIFVKSREKITDYPDLNRRGEQMVGNVYNVSKAIENGFGKVKVGDSEWRVACNEDLAVGKKVEVTSVDGATLIVVKSLKE